MRKMIKKLTSSQIQLRRRLLELAFDNQSSHLGSSFSTLDMLTAIYQAKRKKDLCVLSNGHAGYALYVVLEKNKLLTIQKGDKLPVHPEKALNKAITVSSGSLGQGLPIAVGLALGNPNSNVFCTISDGEATEGSIWEALRLIQDLPVVNIMILVNANGWGAYSQINLKTLQKRLRGFGFAIASCDGHNLSQLTKHMYNFVKTRQPQLLFCQTLVNHFPFLRGQDAHYHVMSKTEYSQAISSLEQQ
ncbi:MAG: hypothetical protein COU66_03005 [Candidatus Pacebacteria bacterium CG10_big_fil_rev_8_21_14_0_10_44_11]|nr:MAG: hypothetical protein COU66_03005 [Candidatus Pacebacteria bacterium CG10_big_fil_rev_8_21_14_0_10_44_11]